MWENVAKHGSGEAVGISCGKKDAIPNIGICFSKVKRDCSAGNSTGRWKKRVGMVMRIIERVMLE
jgi:hypothetical protein